MLAELKPQLESLLKERKQLMSSMSQSQPESQPVAQAQPVVAKHRRGYFCNICIQ